MTFPAPFREAILHAQRVGDREIAESERAETDTSAERWRQAKKQRFTPGCIGEDDPECATEGCYSSVQPGEGICEECRDDRREEE